MSIKDDDIIIHPVKTKNDPTLPSFGLLFVNPSEAKQGVSNTLENGGQRHFLHNSQLAVTNDGNKFLAGPAIGAPAAVLVMEKLIVLGAKRLILMGWCGALNKDNKIGDIVIPTHAFSGEGTSRYYLDDMRSKPSMAIVEKLTKECDENDIAYSTGGVWSTDAPYREDRQFLMKIQEEEQIIGVDMEFSALCSVAIHRQVDFGAIMVVSDEVLGELWRPGFNKQVFKEKCESVRILLEQMVW